MVRKNRGWQVGGPVRQACCARQALLRGPACRCLMKGSQEQTARCQCPSAGVGVGEQGRRIRGLSGGRGKWLVTAVAHLDEDVVPALGQLADVYHRDSLAPSLAAAAPSGIGVRAGEQAARFARPAVLVDTVDPDAHVHRGPGSLGRGAYVLQCVWRARPRPPGSTCVRNLCE